LGASAGKEDAKGEMITKNNMFLDMQGMKEVS
jgi:hypothetical protein